MSKSFIKARSIVRHFTHYRLETGFSMLEAVVVVGVLLALAVGGFFAYGPIAENAKRAKVESAASEVHTGVLVASMDGNPATNPQDVIDTWNNSTDKIHVEILEAAPAVAAMTTAAPSKNADDDVCVEAINVKTPYIKARRGACSDVTSPSDADIDGDDIPNSSDPDIDGDGTPNGSDPDIDGDGIPNAKDETPGGDPLNEDIDQDGILNDADPDIDGDGILNVSDDDIDGDGSMNAGDATPYGEGSYSGPSTSPSLTAAPTGLATDPNVVISSVGYAANSLDVNFNLAIKVGPGGSVGIIYHFQYRITCSLPDGSQFYKLGHIETYYKSSSPSAVTYTGSCPQNAGITTAVGYVAGAYNSHPGLIKSTSYRGPANVATGGMVTPLRGHDESATAPAGSNVDTRVLIRNVKIKDSSIDVGLALENGNASGSGNIYGLQYRMTCQLPDGSQYYKHGTVQTSYKAGDYPAPVFNFPCPVGSIARGYIVGPDGGDPALNSSIGYRGPRNVMRGGIVSPLEGLTPSIVAANQAYSHPRISIRTLTYSGNTANIGINVNLGGVTFIGGNFSVSYRLTCKNTTNGAITYKTDRIQTSYGNGSSNPALAMTAPCAVGNEVVGVIAGPALAHPALTAGSSYGGPTNYAMVGQQ